jgi:hypothetical protein
MAHTKQQEGSSVYRCFIQEFLDLAHPMFNLTWKDSAWQWGEAEKFPFEAIQTCVISDLGVPGRNLTIPSGS